MRLAIRRTTLLLWAALSCGFLIGCSDGLKTAAGEYPVPVGFRTEAGTKASSSHIWNTTTGVIPSGTSFILDAWTEEASSAPDFFTEQTVHNEGGSASGNFVYSPRKYWPLDGELTFIARWPAVCTGLVKSADGKTFSMTVPADASLQDDLLIAGPVVTAMPQDGVVGLPFRHVMSRISVSASVDAAFAAAGLSVTINSVSLEGVASEADYDTDSASWGNLSGPSTYTCDLTGSDSGILLLLPQTLQGITLKMDYTVHVLDGNGGFLSSQDYSLSTPVPGTAWQQGKAYAYALTLRETHLDATVSVLPWDVRENTYDYSTEITINGDGMLRWQAGTYASANIGTFTLITAFGTDPEAEFFIETPEGAVWYAILETVSGASDAFRFVDADGNLSESARGLVGEPSSIRIRATNPYPSETNQAVLSFVVRTAGRNIPVTGLVDNLNHNWTIIQNANY